MKIKAVIDTNVIVSALSSRSVHHWLIKFILNNSIDLFITSEILLEYEEILSKKYSDQVASNFIIALKELPNVHVTEVYYKWNLIADPDDNKFTDCYVASDAQYLVSNDNHFSILKTIPFPKINLIRLQELELLVHLSLTKENT